MKKVLEEINNELMGYKFDISYIGKTTYIDGYVDGLKKAKEIIEKELKK